MLQPALPHYRIDFFQRLYNRYGNNFMVYYSPTKMGALTDENDNFSWAKPIGTIAHPIKGVEWQRRAIRVPIKRGDVVIVCGAPRTLSTLVVLLLARAKGAKTVWWGQYWGANSTELKKTIRMFLSKMSDCLLFYTDQEALQYAEDNNDDRPTGALNNGISISKIKEYRLEYDPVKRANNILFIGRLTRKANLTLLLQALSDERLTSCTLHVVGDGDEEETLRQLAKDQGVEKRIVWYGGISDERKIADVANLCSVFVYPGQVGLSLIHAMAYGLPCIIHNTKKRHMPEIAAFEADVTGSAFCEGSSQSLATSLVEMMVNNVEMRQMSANCITSIDDDFNTESMARRFGTFIKSIQIGGGYD